MKLNIRPLLIMVASVLSGILLATVYIVMMYSIYPSFSAGEKPVIIYTSGSILFYLLITDMLKGDK